MNYSSFSYRIIRFVVMLIFISLSVNLSAKSQQDQNKVQQKNNLLAYAFLSSKCPHCHRLQHFLISYTRDNSWLTIDYNIIDQDKAALMRFNDFLQKDSQTDFRVPSLYFCNTRWVGFNEANQQQLIKGLNFCHEQLKKSQQLSAKDRQLLNNWSTAYSISPANNANLSQTNSLFILVINDLLKNFIVAFTLLVILLANKQSINSMAITTTYLLMAALVHYFTQYYAQIYFQILPYSHVITFILGGSVLVYCLKPHKIKKSAIWLMLSGLIGAGVSWYSQIDNPNLAIVFANVLQFNSSSLSAKVFSAFIYQLTYITGLALVATGLYLIAIKSKVLIRHKEIIQIFALRYLMILGLVFIIYPGSLSSEHYLIVSSGLVALSLKTQKWIKNYQK